MLNPSASTHAQHRNPGAAICAELLLSSGVVSSLFPLLFFFLLMKRSMSKLLQRTASVFSTGSVGNRDTGNTAGNSTTSARVEDGLHG